jgi:p-hydroxybenzoate 3-monooxygenase
METSRTQVVIIGAGPAGLLLGQLLLNQGIDHVILELRSADYVRGRVRAGVLEMPTLEALREARVSDRLDRESMRMPGFNLMWGEDSVHIDFALVNKYATVYGQTKITRDLMDARQAGGGVTHYEISNTQPHDFDTAHPWVSYEKDGRQFRIDCDFIAGCDGHHGATHKAAPADQITTYDYAFPFGWLAMLADVPPISEQVAWMNHPDGFLMCSLRSKTRSRYYFQVPRGEELKNWNADRFWKEYRRRLPPSLVDNLVTGPALEMSITPLSSSVSTPMRFGRMFLAGDAAHVVPPTGAKGLNMAMADAKLLFEGLKQYYGDKQNSTLLDSYSDDALARVWKAVRFSWWMTNLTHKLSDNPFNRKMQLAELEYISQSVAAQTTIAENFCGLRSRS